MMLRHLFFIIILYVFSASAGHLAGQGFQNILLNDIARDIASYKEKTVTLKLKFKFADNIFNKIYFYDSKNIDIVFDISVLKTGDSFRRDMVNLHQGLDYLVTFTVKDVGALGLLTGELQGFTIYALTRLPEGGEKAP
jgi:uncharacterized secreted protein with C-terminal beta-propeller domain